jgi:transposase
MSDQDKKKIAHLLETETFNPNAASVTDELFLNYDFFDPHDLMQVKYEMLRKVSEENCPVTEAVELFGISRPYYYKLKAAFAERGMSGLQPQKRGPKGAYKLTAEITPFIDQRLAENPRADNTGIAQQIAQHFEVKIHPRSIDRYRKGQKKSHPGSSNE